MTTLAKWSVEDYHRMIAAGILCDRHVERLAADIVQISPEGSLHASRIRKVANYLRSLLNGLALLSEAHPITLQQSEPEPDIAIVRLPESRYDERHPSSEDIFWLIEISDTTLMFDLNKKKQIYAVAGINEYWVMNVNANSLTVFRQPTGNDYSLKYEMSHGELIPLTFPEIFVPVDKLFK
jgi:Uma2 family endonuclease